MTNSDIWGCEFSGSYLRDMDVSHSRVFDTVDIKVLQVGYYPIMAVGGRAFAGCEDYRLEDLFKRVPDEESGGTIPRWKSIARGHYLSDDKQKIVGAFLRYARKEWGERLMAWERANGKLEYEIRRKDV